MPDKSKADKASEESLSLACGELSEALELIGGAASILRQIFNRWPQANQFIDRLDQKHAQIHDLCDAAQARVIAEIAANSERNNGKKATR